MSGEGTSERGPKPPRTMFSLGRPGASKGSTSTPPEAAEEPVVDAVDAPVEEGGVEETLGADELEYEYLCGNCAEPLPTGAAECPACGTPVALADEEYLDDYDDRLGDEDEVALVDDGGADEDGEGGEYEDHRFGGAVAAGAAGAMGALAADDLLEEHGVGADAGAAEGAAAPAAVLYADPSVTEPLPPEPSGEWGIAAPVIGTAAGDELAEEAGPADAELAEEPAAAYGEEPGQAEESPASEEPAAAYGEEPALAEEPGAYDEPAADGHEPVAAGLVGAGVAGAAMAGMAGEAEAATLEHGAYQPPEAVPTASTLPYGSGPLESSAPTGKSKTPIIVGAVAAVVIVGVILGLVLAGGGNKDDVKTAQPASTTTTAVAGGTKGAGGEGTSTTAKATTTTAKDDGSTTTTVATSSTETTASTTPTSTPVSTAPPTTTQVVTVVTPPPTQATTTTVAPGRITATPGSGGSVSVAKVGSFQITLTNTGGRPAQCNLSAGNGLTLANNCAPSIPPGGSVTVTVQATGTFEGNTGVSGLVEGIGSYNLSVFVKNG